MKVGIETIQGKTSWRGTEPSKESYESLVLKWKE